MPYGNSIEVFTGLDNSYVYSTTPDSLHFRMKAGTGGLIGEYSILGITSSTDSNNVNVGIRQSSASTGSAISVYPSNLYANLAKNTVNTIIKF